MRRAIAHQAGRCRSTTPISARCAGLPGASTRRSPPAAAPSRSIPIIAGALSNLGIALFDQGKFDEALGHYDRAIALDANFAQAHSNRGNALQRLKRFADAEPPTAARIELQPSFADAWNNLGTCLRELKRSDEAEAVYRKALELAPNNPDTLDNLALALKDLDRLDEAADLMRRALAIESRNDKLYRALRHRAARPAQDRRGRRRDRARARAQLRTITTRVNLMGRIAFRARRPRRRARLLPARACAQARPRRRLQQHGQRAQGARPIAGSAGRLSAKRSGSIRTSPASMSISRIRRNSQPGDPHLAAMEALAAKPDGLSKTDRMQLDFALGKAYADLKDYRRSFTASARRQCGQARDDRL